MILKFLTMKIANLFYFFFSLLVLTACSSQFNKGVTNKRELRSKTSPSLKIAKEYDKISKKQERKAKRFSKIKDQEKANEKRKAKQRKEGEQYLKRKRRKFKRGKKPY